MKNKNQNKNQKRAKKTIMHASVKKYDTLVLTVSKTTLKRPVDEKTKRRQLRYAKKLVNDDLLFTI